MKKYTGAFTLVELIVIMTIIAILATLSYVYFSGNLSKSRDSVRIADFASFQKRIDLFRVKYSSLPVADNMVNINYTGSILWKQGTIGKTMLAKLDGFGNDIPLDPLYGNEYTYSVTPDNLSYQIGGILENYHDDNEIAFIPSAYAASGENAYILGNYNGLIAQAFKNGVYYIIATPSIIASDISDTNILSILSNQKLAYHEYRNLPHSYSGKTDTNGGFYLNIANPVIYTGSLSYLSSYSGVTDLSKAIKVAYAGTILQNTDKYENFIKKGGIQITKSILTKYFRVSWAKHLNCTDIKDAGDDSGDCYYTIDADGLGANISSQVYCNMSVDGGGWTRVGDNYLTNGDFPSGSGITTQWGSNANNTIVPILSPVTSGYAVYQYGNIGWPEWQNAQSEYEVHFPSNAVMKAGYEIWMTLWVADAWNGGFPTILNHNPVAGYLFHNRLFYTDGTNSINGPVETLDTQVVAGKTWKLQRVRTKILKTPNDFHWYIGYDAEKVTNLYFTGVRLELFYR